MPSPHRDRTANDIEKHRCVTRHVMRKYNNVARLRHFCGGGSGTKKAPIFFLCSSLGGICFARFFCSGRFVFFASSTKRETKKIAARVFFHGKLYAA